MTPVGISQANTNATGWSTSKSFTNVNTAIAREKQVKGWRREKKNRLVESKNPGWKDLASDWYPDGLLKDGKPFEPK
jgi:hypothetical protein